MTSDDGKPAEEPPAWLVAAREQGHDYVAKIEAGARRLEQHMAAESKRHREFNRRINERLGRAEPRAPAADDVAPASRPPLPNPKQLAAYTHGTLKKAVTAFERDATAGAVVRGSGKRLSPKDAARVLRMYGLRLLRLNDAGELVVDPRVARKGARYVLRYLDDTGTRWLDPLVVDKSR